MSRLNRPPISGSLVMALLFAGGVWLTPAMSRASCGHYITSATLADGAVVIGLEELHALEALIDASRSPAAPAAPASPCGGLRCSQDHPLPPPAPRVEPRIDPWGGLRLLMLSPQALSTSIFFEDDLPSLRVWPTG